MRNRLLIALLAVSVIAVGCADPGSVDSDQTELAEASGQETATTNSGDAAVTDDDDQDQGPGNTDDDPESQEPGTVDDGEDGSVNDDQPIGRVVPVEPPPADTTPAIVGEVPDGILSAILQDAEERVGGEPDFTVLRSEAVVWSDGALGCPEPGQSYTQALVDGYWVVLQVGDVQLDYRVTERGIEG